MSVKVSISNGRFEGEYYTLAEYARKWNTDVCTMQQWIELGGVVQDYVKIGDYYWISKKEPLPEKRSFVKEFMKLMTSEEAAVELGKGFGKLSSEIGRKMMKYSSMSEIERLKHENAMLNAEVEILRRRSSKP